MFKEQILELVSTQHAEDAAKRISTLAERIRAQHPPKATAEHEEEEARKKKAFAKGPDAITKTASAHVDVACSHNDESFSSSACCVLLVGQLSKCATAL